MKFKPLVLRATPALVIALSFVYVQNLSIASSTACFLFFLLVFWVSKSCSIGILNIFIGLSTTTFLSGISHVIHLKIDSPLVVTATFVTFTLLFAKFGRKMVTQFSASLHHFEICLAFAMASIAIPLAGLTHMGSTNLFAMLLPEDNAAWIHAASGLISHQQTVGSVVATNYGVGLSLATCIAIVSQLNEFLTGHTGSSQALITVANTYVLFILLLMAVTSILCFSFFAKKNSVTKMNKIFIAGKFVLPGIVLVFGLGKVFLVFGHLSLVFALYTFTAIALFLKQSVTPNSSSNLWRINFCAIASFSLGTSWLPLIPIALLLVISQIAYFVLSAIKYRSEYINAYRILGLVFSSSVCVAVLVLSIHYLRIPNGYSVSQLINSAGGVVAPTEISLTLSLIGLFFSQRIVASNSFLRGLLILVPLALLGYWMSWFLLSPNTSSYSIDKFALFIALLGVPLLLGQILQSFEEKFPQVNLVSALLVPLLILLCTWGVAYFPSAKMLNDDDVGINYLPVILELSDLDPLSQIQCISAIGQFDAGAYTCSRFASALQFKEVSDSFLSRRWRSALLGDNFDPVNFPSTNTFGIAETTNRFLISGGNLTVILTPGPLGAVYSRPELAWFLDIHQTAIKVIQ